MIFLRLQYLIIFTNFLRNDRYFDNENIYRILVELQRCAAQGFRNIFFL